MRHKLIYKSIYISLLISFSTLSCKTNKAQKEYIRAYKNVVMYECINNASNWNLSTFSENNDDLGYAPEVGIIYHSDALHAKEVGIRYSKEIKPINYSDYENRKPIFSKCANFANSDSVHTIAKTKYKVLRKFNKN